MKKTIALQIVLTLPAALIIPLGIWFVDPYDSFGFLLLALFGLSPLCFALIGFFSGRHSEKRTAWLMPLLCVAVWSAVQFMILTTDVFVYSAIYLLVSYLVMLATWFVRKWRKRGTDDAEMWNAER